MHRLSPESRTNIQMDENATKLAERLILCPHLKVYSGHHPKALPPYTWQQITVTQCLTKQLYTLITSNKVQQRWINKGKLSPNSLCLIDHTAMSNCIPSLNLNMKRFITKWSCECLATGKKMELWQLRHKGNCPFCLSSQEDTHHILRCSHQDSITHWTTTIRRVQLRNNAFATTF